jgi:PAS domain S-box-containing protein
MKTGIKKIVLLSFILALFCLVFIAFYAYRNFQLSSQTNKENNLTVNVLSSLGHLFDDMQNLETVDRDHLFSGKENFPGLYYSAIKEYPDYLSSIKSNAVKDPLELSYIREIETLTRRKVELTKDVVASFNKSRSSINENNLIEQGKKVMDSIRILNALIEGKEFVHQRHLSELAERTSRRMYIIFFMCLFTLSLFLTAFYFAVAKIISDRKKTQHTIKENEEKYRKLFDNNPLPMMICEKESLQFLDVNEAALKQYGYSREEFLSLNIMDIQPEENGELRFEKYKYLMTPDKNNPIKKHKRKDGSILEAQMAYCDTLFYEVDATLVLANDITAMLKTQEENKRLATVLENTSDFVTLTDLEQRTIFVNKAARKALKYEETEDLSRKGLLDYLPAKNKAYFSDNIFPVAFVQGVWRGEGVWIDKEQKKIPVSQVILVEKPRNGASGFIASIARDISEAKSKELEIKQMNEHLRALAASLQNIREEERSNIAREIHDDLGQQLTAIKIDVSWIAKKTQGNEQVKQKIDSIMLMLNETVKSIRRISTQLRPSILDDLGLIEALKWQTEEFQKRYGIAVNFMCSKEKLLLDSPTATGFFRIFQEALTNIARHSDATRVEVSLRIVDKELVLCVQDNGRGFKIDEARIQKTLGLLGMKERALMMGGRFEINNIPTQGVIVKINVPLNIQE